MWDKSTWNRGQQLNDETPKSHSIRGMADIPNVMKLNDAPNIWWRARCFVWYAPCDRELVLCTERFREVHQQFQPRHLSHRKQPKAIMNSFVQSHSEKVEVSRRMHWMTGSWPTTSPTTGKRPSWGHTSVPVCIRYYYQASRRDHGVMTNSA